MQTGFAMLYVGSVHINNVKNTMLKNLLKNLLDTCGAALAFFIVSEF
jgi:ammonia channel protein AmtB